MLKIQLEHWWQRCMPWHSSDCNLSQSRTRDHDGGRRSCISQTDGLNLWNDTVPGEFFFL